MANSSPILIAGAGIAGLATAIGLARKGFAVTLLDRRPVLSEAGAGIQIGPNGVKALECIGVREAVEAVAFKPVGLTIRQGASGAKLTTLPWGAVAKNRYGAPFLTLLRTELQAALLAATRSSPGIELVLGFEVARIDTGGEGVTVKTDDGRGARGSALIGADGLWSRVRAEVGPIDPKPTGYVAYRAVIARAGLPAPFDAPEAGIWLGRTAHVVHYPVRGGDWLNLVVVVGGRETTRDWDELGQIAGIAPHLSQWPINLRDMLARAPGWRRWTLYDLPNTNRWSSGQLVLIGDAAHPVLPFLAQGAVMGLEDAVALAEIVGAAGGPGPGAFARFEGLRRSRVEKLAAASRRNGPIYHMGGIAAMVRDAVLRLTPPERLLGQFDWLYGFEPAAVPKP